MKTFLSGHYGITELHSIIEPFNNETSPEDMLTCLEKYLNKKLKNVEQEIDPVKESKTLDKKERYTIEELFSADHDCMVRENI